MNGPNFSLQQQISDRSVTAHAIVGAERAISGKLKMKSVKLHEASGCALWGAASSTLRRVKLPYSPGVPRDPAGSCEIPTSLRSSQ